MNLAIPVYIEEHKLPGEASSQFALRPLFFQGPAKSARQLSAGMSKLAQAVRHHLDSLAGKARQEELIPWTFSPALTEHRLKLPLQLRRQTADIRLLVVTFEALDRRIAVAPALPGLFFEVLRGQDVGERAREVITDHFRRREKEEGESFALPRQLTTCVRAWATALELDVHSNPSLPKAEVGAELLALVSGGTPDGRTELQRVGRCLDWLYPDELERAVLREAEVEELTRLLAERDRRPVLLVGPRRVGKTALVHEAVYRRVSGRPSPHVQRRNVWLLSPARLISGMSYVGQWEGRVLAILEYAAKQEHVLYFDDVLGLYHAGRSADSDLSVAAVMRPWVERRDFRLLAETTPEALGVLREQDRGMADLFHVLPVREPSEGQSRRILMHVVRSQEDRHRSRFGIEALPTTMDLGRRYLRDQAMPGKAAGFLAQLALKYRERDVTRETVLAEFAARSGLSVTFLDANARLERGEVVEALGKEVIGQGAALGALADVVTVAKARLNDPGRPLGTLLFLGPTGVGKTAAAKALAKYLYGDESRLLRFDMNEYVDAAAPARLVGTFARPDGQLTAAVRRQPYCVLLLDEIEKAHPAVFDLLLQLLGEGRLTDALGRTSDVTGAVVIMTSNLGTRQAAASFGLRPAAAASRQQSFVDAAAAFFRPEFVNRIDRIVPFEPLGRAEVAAIANKLIAELFRREGLAHRRCVLDVDPVAMDRIIDQGYHPQLGARALKRAVERQLTAPIAARLAALAPDAPTVVSVYAGGEGIAAYVQPLLNATALPRPVVAGGPAEVDAVLTRVEEYVNEVEARNAALDAGAGARVSADSLSAGHFHYFAVREQIQRIDRMIEQIDHAMSRRSNPNRRTPRVKPQRRMRTLANGSEGYAMLLRPGDVHARLAELARRAVPVGDAPEERVAELVQECAHLEVLSAAAAEGDEDRALLHVRPVGGGGDAGLLDELRDAYLHLFQKSYGFSAIQVDAEDAAGRFVLLEMPAIARLLTGESGAHLVHVRGQNVLPVLVSVVRLAPGQDAADVVAGERTARDAWRRRLASGADVTEAGPPALGRVVRVYDPESVTLDVRTGLLCDGLPRGEDLRRFVLAALPIPAALRAASTP